MQHELFLKETGHLEGDLKAHLAHEAVSIIINEKFIMQISII